MAHRVEQLIFVGFNTHVAALDADTGTVAWNWKIPKPRMSGYVTLLLRNATQLIVSSNGYMYCVEPSSGRLLWQNEMAGYGVGVASLAAVGTTGPSIVAAAAQATSAAAAASNA